MMPRLYLAVDNCFASKRWTHPREWMSILADMGVFCVEASADNEIDPLYSTPDTLRRWLDDTQAETAKTGVRVVNLYSGHGSYATLGLAHDDPAVRDHIQHDWLEPMLRNAAVLGAGLGFYCHAFSQKVLHDPALYAEHRADLYRRLAELTRYAGEVGAPSISLEQMYSPHQIPWTIEGSQQLVCDVFAQAGKPMYLTLDTGHQVGQRRYLKPTREQVERYAEQVRAGIPRETLDEPWLGAAQLYNDLASGRVGVDEVMAAVDARPYLFAQEEDGDLYTWLRRLGGYSNIIHLQQTDGTASAHRPFTARYNATGIVEPPRVFEALHESYTSPQDATMPPRTDVIYLTVEMFSPTAERPIDSIRNLRETIAYWRRYLPQDGMTLDEVLKIPSA